MPIPDTVLDGTWVNHEIIVEPFVNPSEMGIPLEAELWSWSSSEPEGICLALARWFTDGPNVDKAYLLDVICLGRQSSKACFFENWKDTLFSRGQSQPLSAFAGGADLVANDPDSACTDCHAGENPFIIHPEKDAFKDLMDDPTRRRRLQPASFWYEPIAPAGTASFPWPHNPGPDTRLDAIASMGSCTTHHALPEVSTALARYCIAVLPEAVLRETETMPPAKYTPKDSSYSDYRLLYRNHYRALLEDFCVQDPPTLGGVIITGVAHVDDTSIISPPTVVEPNFACGRNVEVLGVLPHAEVRLYVNGVTSSVSTIFTNVGGGVSLSVPGGLVDGDVLTARQVVGGVQSALSPSATAIEYPNDTLPKPVIDPIVHVCAQSFSVLSVPGARLDVWYNGNHVGAGFMEGSRDTVYWGPTFASGDFFTVQASLCSKTSPPSDPAMAQEPPDPLLTPRFAPEQTYAGQELIHLRELDYGSFAKVSRTAPSPLYLGETLDDPRGLRVSFYLPGSALGHALEAGEVLSAEPSLYCPGGPSGTTSFTQAALPCEYLPAPEVAAPMAGQDYLSVLDALPGARIRVYDALDKEIADGAGTVIRLVPPRVFAAGEFIVVVQQVGTCFGTTGFRIGVGGGG